MKILKVDHLVSGTLLRYSISGGANAVAPRTATFTCIASKLPIDSLEDELQILYRLRVMKDIPYRKSKRRRIQKKFNKRYGFKQYIGYNETLYNVLSYEVNLKSDSVTFECIRAEDFNKINTINF